MSPDQFFGPWERMVSDWQDCTSAIESAIALAGTRELAWRGLRSNTFGLQSLLARKIEERTGSFPDEAGLVAAEERILEAARSRWRYDQLPALELLAHIQHFGGPTRLLDVSFNPLVALWFAVEDTPTHENATDDGRLFAFDVTNQHVRLDAVWGGRDLPWSAAPAAGWRTDLPRVWRPPSYNDRIPAQNAAFLVGGSPQVDPGGNMRYRRGPGDGAAAGTWPIGEVREVSSVHLHLVSADRAIHEEARPTQVIRIRAGAKEEIRDRLEKSFGFSVGSIYPDLYGLAKQVEGFID